MEIEIWTFSILASDYIDDSDPNINSNIVPLA
jgi:hypothetical protein